MCLQVLIQGGMFMQLSKSRLTLRHISHVYTPKLRTLSRHPS